MSIGRRCVEDREISRLTSDLSPRTSSPRLDRCSATTPSCGRRNAWLLAFTADPGFNRSDPRYKKRDHMLGLIKAVTAKTDP